MSYTPVGLVGYNCKPHPMGPVPQALWCQCEAFLQKSATMNRNADRYWGGSIGDPPFIG